LRHDVLALWQALENQEPLPAVDGRSVRVAVWRSGFQVLHRAMPEMEALALARALGRGTLAEVCDLFSSAEDAQKQAFQTLGGWFTSGWVARVESP